MMSDTFILNFRGDQITDELLIYHALITLESCIERPWELVVDFTHTTLENRFSVSGKIYILLLLETDNLLDSLINFMFSFLGFFFQRAEVVESEGCHRVCKLAQVFYCY